GQLAVVEEKDVVQVAGDFLGGINGGVDFVVAARRRREIGRQEAELDLAAQRQVTAQALLADADGIEVHILEDAGRQQTHGRQQPQVFGVENVAGAVAIELDRAERLAVVAEQWHAEQRRGINGIQGAGDDKLPVLVNVFAQDPAADLDRRADDGSAVGDVGIALSPLTLGTDHQAVALAQHDQSAIGQGEELQQVFQELVEQRLQLEGLPQVLSQLQDGLQLLLGVVGKQVGIADQGINLFADGPRGAFGLGVGLKTEDEIAERQSVAVLQRFGPRDPVPVEQGAVGAAEVLDEVRSVLPPDLGVA